MLYIKAFVNKIPDGIHVKKRSLFLATEKVRVKNPAPTFRAVELCNVVCCVTETAAGVVSIATGIRRQANCSLVNSERRRLKCVIKSRRPSSDK